MSHEPFVQHQGRAHLQSWTGHWDNVSTPMQPIEMSMRYYPLLFNTCDGLVVVMATSAASDPRQIQADA